MNRFKFTMDSGNTFTSYFNDDESEKVVQLIYSPDDVFINLKELILTKSKIESVEITVDEESQQ